MFCKSLLIITIFAFSLVFSTLTNALKSESNIWEALTNEFSLNHEIHHPEVQKQLKWIINHPDYLKKMTQQSKPYIYHILKEIKKHNMPGEIALIPMIESEYDPFSSSNKGAAGLWQLMPDTGAELGLRKDWWVDGRRSIGPSTDAALNYLDHLHRFFHGNWILAFAAYNSGEGTVSRAMRRNQQKQFWSLSLPHETKAYIPRLLALSEIIQNPKRYHIQLPEIAHEPYFKEVSVDKLIDINHAAKLTKVSSYDLHRLNPGFKDWSTQPYRPYKLLIPTEHVADFNRNLANLTGTKAQNKSAKNEEKPLMQQYTVKQGDTLTQIAHQHHLKLLALKKLNPHLKNDRLKLGQQLIIAAQ